MAGAEEEPVLLRPGDKEVWEDLQHVTKNAVEVQRQLLEKILKENANTEYLRRTQLNGRTDEASFKAAVPIITYADIEADIQRIMDGDKSPILTAEPVARLTLSSGTSGGKSKMIPVTARGKGEAAFKMGKRNDLLRNMVYPLEPGSRCISFSYAGRMFPTKGGLVAATDSTSFFRSDMFKNRVKDRVGNPPATVSPDEVILGYDIRESMYCHLLCGLKRYREIQSLNSLFAYGLVEGFRCLEQAWRELAEDLRTGEVSRERVRDPDIRAAVEKLLAGPDHEAASRVEEECASGEWEGIVKRLWPNAKFVIGIVTGAMRPYVPVLKRYLGPDLPLVSGDYGSSEAWLGSNLNPRNKPEDAVFTLVPDVAYIEFIPLYRPDEGAGEDLHLAATADYLEGPPVGIADVKVGQIYELVFTTSHGGLCRYRMSDIVKVVGFYNQTPKVEFLCRKNVVLSVNTDKTDEAELMAVVAKAALQLRDAGLELSDFTSHADMTARPGSYVIYWELKSSTNLPQEVLQKCCTLLDQSFNNPYMRGRVAKTIGPLKLRIVREGTFGKLLEYAVSIGGGNQYKTPRYVTSARVLEVLQAEVVQEFVSPDFPDELLAAWKPLADELPELSSS